jgi:tetratricopeptide (TPR) repeat protein
LSRKQSNKKRAPLQQTGVTIGKTSATSGSQPAPRFRHPWLFRLGALVLIPALLLGFLELGLRLGGYGYSPAFFKRIKIGEEACLVENDKFGLSFFPPSLARIPAPVVMKADKPAGLVRIFIFGESAALGDPRPNYGAGRYLQVLLRERFPAAEFEVVNTAITAINSHAILPIARECARHQGNIWLIYMGNNEMVGPFGAATVFGPQAPPLAIVRLSLALQRTRLGQLLTAAGRKLHGRGSSNAPWQGMEMFLGNQVPPRDPRRERVYRNFAQNLRDIVEIGARSGARVLLSTVAVNLKDCPPFASLGATNLEPAQAKSFEELMKKAATANGEGDFKAAESLYEAALKLLPSAADAQFQLGDCLLHLTNSVHARQHFQEAVDDDTLPFRADSRINGLIRSTGREFESRGLLLCEAASRLADDEPETTAGKDCFYEHVHLNFDGNYRLARLWAEQVEKLLPAGVSHNGPSNWLSQAQCERLLGLTDWNRLSVVEEVIGRIKQPPLSAQSNNSQRLQALEAWAASLRQSTKSNPPAEARLVYVEALKRAPADHGLHEAFAEFLEDTRDLAQAAAERQRVCELIPQYYFPYYSLATVLKDQGKLGPAREALLRALELNPGSGDVRLELGIVCAREGKWENALREFDAVRSALPEDPRVLLYRGEVLRKLNRRGESLESLREAIRLAPDYWEAHYRLGEELAQAGDAPGAITEFKAALRSHPDYAKTHLSLGAALARTGRLQEAVAEFDEALRLDPENKQALEFRRQALRQLGQ